VQRHVGTLPSAFVRHGLRTVGLLHPGEMGTAVGAALRGGGVEVLWASEGRTPATRTRAARDGLTDAGTIAQLAEQSDVIFSVCPPHAALGVARAVAAQHFDGTFVDVNAVAPATAREVAGVLAPVVDGGIIGGPPRAAGATRLYLSGPGAGRIAALFAGSPLDAIVIEGNVGAASALKMAYAAWTKGTSALLIAIRALGAAEGVDDALLREWAISQPDLSNRSEGAVRGTASKAWRFVGEMHEIADTFATSGLPDDFHRAAAEIYARMAGFKDVDHPPTLDEVTHEIRRSD
jgi:3-hydroxyisobutyrate dehydrogenase-like beta-hydroxyacid dehydrogenase